jgi:Protein of unknown function (DUF4238)
MPHPEGDKHHYIPKFYLKRWAAADGRVTEYSRPYKRVEPRWTHPDGTGFKRGLYAIPGMSPEQVNLVEEQFLKPADNLASMTLDDLIAGSEFLKPAEMRRDWSRFVFSLLLRFPEAQQAMRKDLAENVRQQTMAAPDPAEEFRRIAESNDLDRATAQIFLELLKSSKVTTTLLNMTCEVIKLRLPKNTFLTSDRPVIKTGRLFGLVDAHLVMPISPVHLFIASNSERVFTTLKSRAHDRLVAQCNNVIVQSASRYVWGVDNSQLRFIEKRLTKAPEAWRPAPA